MLRRFLEILSKILFIIGNAIIIFNICKLFYHLMEEYKAFYKERRDGKKE